MIHALLIPLALSVPLEPVDPDIEVLVVESTFDAEAVCEPLALVVPLLGQLLGDYQLATDMVIAYGVEIYEEGYGRNLTEAGEDRLIELMEDCL